MTDGLFRLSGAGRPPDPGVDEWFAHPGEELRRMVQPYFQTMRRQSHSVRELLHDGRPTACVGDVPFAYVDAFKAHAAVGFFYGAALQDQFGLLEGTGKNMRHIKLRWGQTIDNDMMSVLISRAFSDAEQRRRAAKASEG